MGSERAQRITLEYDCQNKPIMPVCKSRWKVQNRSKVTNDSCSYPWKRNKGLGHASPVPCKRTGCSPLVVCEEQHHLHCSGLYLVGEEQDCDSLWAGKEWDRDVLQQAQGKGWLSQKVGIAPIPPAMPSLGCKGPAKTTENGDGVNFHPQRKATESSKGPESCSIENTNDSALE